MDSTDEMNATITKLYHVGNGAQSCMGFSYTTEKLNKVSHWYSWNNSVSTVGFKLRIERNYAKYVLSYYLPSFLIVILSWVSFAIPPEVIPGRMTLLITLVLVLVNKFGTVIEKRPRTNVTVLDIWMIGCLIFVSGALMAYAVLLLHQRFIMGNDLISTVKTVAPADNKFQDSNKSKGNNHYKEWDRYSLIGFPLTALIFNLIYWPVVFFKR